MFHGNITLCKTTNDKEGLVKSYRLHNGTILQDLKRIVVIGYTTPLGFLQNILKELGILGIVNKVKINIF